MNTLTAYCRKLFTENASAKNKLTGIVIPEDILVRPRDITQTLKDGFLVRLDRSKMLYSITKIQTNGQERDNDDNVLTPGSSDCCVGTDEYAPPAILKDVLAILQSPKTSNIWFYGPTQCGKTVAVDWLCKQLDRVLFKINCSGQMRRSDFFGQNVVVIDPATKQNKIVFAKGIVEKAMTCGLDETGEAVGKPGILFIDEAASMPVEVSIGLNHLLESKENVREITLPEDGGRVVKSHPDFRVILAGNTNGGGSGESSAYLYSAQKKAQDVSFLQRMSYVFRFGYNKKAEENIILFKARDVASLFIDFKNAVREALKNNSLTTPFSTKKVIDICDFYQMEKSQGTAPEQAMSKAIYYSYYSAVGEVERSQIAELFFPIFGTDLTAWGSDDGTDY